MWYCCATSINCQNAVTIRYEHGLEIPLSAAADGLIRTLRQASGSRRVAMAGATLLGERAALRGMLIPATTSANGSCHLLDAIGDRIAINLARPSDLEMLPALFASNDSFVPYQHPQLIAHVRAMDASTLTAKGRLLGMAVARETEPTTINRTAAVVTGTVVDDIAVELVRGQVARRERSVARVLDLSALWAGPLATHLLWLAGAEVIRVEHRRRPDAMRDGDTEFFALLNQGKASVALDFGDANDLRALLALIASSDIVVEASRPRALEQLGVDATQLAASLPGLVWVTITGHGASGEAADWIGFGDDCGIAGGLSAELRAASGRSGFVGDAIADPLTGIAAALAAWNRWRSGRGGRIGLALRHTVARCLRHERTHDMAAWTACLKSWARAQGEPFPPVERRARTAAVPALGADNHRCLAAVAKS